MGETAKQVAFGFTWHELNLTSPHLVHSSESPQNRSPSPPRVEPHPCPVAAALVVHADCGRNPQVLRGGARSIPSRMQRHTPSVRRCLTPTPSMMTTALTSKTDQSAGTFFHALLYTHTYIAQPKTKAALLLPWAWYHTWPWTKLVVSLSPRRNIARPAGRKLVACPTGVQAKNNIKTDLGLSPEPSSWFRRVAMSRRPQGTGGLARVCRGWQVTLESIG